MAGGSDDADLATRLALLQLEAEYARTWDTQDGAAWARCFTEDGAFEMGSVAGGAPFRCAGRAALEEFCRRGSGRYEGIHLLSPPELTITGDTARGWVHFSYHDRDRKTGSVRHVVGVYAVTYARDSDGWRMASRREQAVLSDGTFHGYPDVARMWAPEVS